MIRNENMWSKPMIQFIKILEGSLWQKLLPSSASYSQVSGKTKPFSFCVWWLQTSGLTWLVAYSLSLISRVSSFASLLPSLPSPFFPLPAFFPSYHMEIAWCSAEACGCDDPTQRSSERERNSANSVKLCAPVPPGAVGLSGSFPNAASLRGAGVGPVSTPMLLMQHRL